jgi:hypothetical protein
MPSASYKVKDLMINVIGTGRGSAGLFIDTPPTPKTPITPIAAVAAYSPKFVAVDKVVKEGADIQALDRMALDIGRAVVGSRVAVALCTEDSNTCNAGQIYSPVASGFMEVLRDADFAVLKENVMLAEKALLEAEATMEQRAVANSAQLLPKMEEAVQFLKGKKAASA